MCMNCGCGQLDTRHKDSDIVRDDVQRAADGQGASIEATAGHLEESLRRLRSGSGNGTAAGATSGSASGTSTASR